MLKSINAINSNIPELGKPILKKKKNSTQTPFIIHAQQKLTLIKKTKMWKMFIAFSLGVRLLSKKLGLLHNGLQPPTNQKVSN